ncbi:MAG: hypothetical protein IJQ81_08790 [Oscillibacter sp.]|nr:hypothetical protein [Oscillibacter sp.]
MTNKPRFSISLDPELAEKVNEYRFNRRITTQSKAIQRLIKLGFDSMENDGNSASAYETELDNQEHELIRIARELDPSRQELLLQIAEVIAQKDSPHMQ